MRSLVLRLMACVLAASGLAGSLYPSIAGAQGQSLVVEGQITNGTSGGGGVEGLSVALHQESATTHEDLETTTVAEGRFQFEGIVFDPAVAYAVTVSYQEALYGRNLDLSAGAPPPVSLSVYDAVDDVGVLSGSSASVLFATASKSTQTVSALEIIKLVNTSNFTYVPGQGRMDFLRFGLPPGSRALQADTVLTGADFVQVDRGFALLASVPPGEHEVAYTYEFPYSGTEVAFSKSLRYGVQHLRILAPVEVLKLSSPELGAAATVTIGSRPYQLIEANDLPKGTEITLELGGLPKASLGDRVSRRLDGVRLEYAAPVGLAILITGLIGYSLWRRAGEARGALGAGSGRDTDVERQTLRQMIAELERSFRGGDTTEEDYRRRRAALDASLTALTK